MSRTTVERVADALLYEGYMLYPYRPSSVKNRQRFNFGVLYPAAWCEAQSGSGQSWMQTECIVSGSDETTLEIRIRFLHLRDRTVARSEGNELRLVERLQVGDRLLQPWREAVEREVVVSSRSLGDLCRGPEHDEFGFPESETREPVADAYGCTVGTIIRRQEPVQGRIELAAEPCGAGRFRVRVRVDNCVEQRSPDGSREGTMLASLVSAHTILTVSRGAFESLLDPPPELRETAAGCRNVGTWPVLVGEEGARDTMLSSPIIIYDYPQIAPESAGDLFDGTEIDEILSLRILTLTEAEKIEMWQSDAHARRILERTESLGAEDLKKMHGAMRPVHPDGETG